MTTPDMPAGGRQAGRVPLRPQSVRLNVRSRPAFSVGKWPATRRLAAVIVAGVVIGAAAGGLRVASAIGAAAGYARTTQQAVLGEQVTALAQAMENERDLTAAYDAALGYDSPAAVGGGASVPAVSGSTLRYYQGQLTQAQQATNALAGRVRTLAAQIGAGFPAIAQNSAQNVVSITSNLAGLRSSALQQPSVSTIQSYTAEIGGLFALNDQIASGSGDAALFADVRALGALSRAKDQASQERAIVDAALIAGSFNGTGGQQALATAQALENAALLAFQESATPAQQNAFLTAASGEQADTAQLLTNFAAAAGDPRLFVSALGLGMTRANAPGRWYSAMSGTIDGMRKVELHVAQAIVARSQALRQGALRSAVLSGAVTAAIALAVLIAAFLAARSPRGAARPRDRAGR